MFRATDWLNKQKRPFKWRVRETVQCSLTDGSLVRRWVNVRPHFSHKHGSRAGSMSSIVILHEQIITFGYLICSLCSRNAFFSLTIYKLFSSNDLKDVIAIWANSAPISLVCRRALLDFALDTMGKPRSVTRPPLLDVWVSYRLARLGLQAVTDCRSVRLVHDILRARQLGISHGLRSHRLAGDFVGGRCWCLLPLRLLIRRLVWQLLAGRPVRRPRGRVHFRGA